MIDLEKSCRTCLRHKNKTMNLLSSLWTDSEYPDRLESISFLEMLSDITIINTKILIDPMLLRICSSCELDLISAYKFKRACEKTEHMLCAYDQRTTHLDSKIMVVKSDTKLTYNKDESAHESIDDKMNKCPIDSEISNTEGKPSNRPSTRAYSIVTYSDDNSSDYNVNDNKDPTFVPSSEFLPATRYEKLSCTDEKNKTTVKEHKDTGQTMSRKKRQYIRRKPLKKKSPKSDRNLGKYCRRCDVKFELRKLYLAHYKQVHMERMPCTLCGKMYYKQNLDKHMISHSNEKNYVCSLCGSRFSYEYNLKSHMRIHSGEKRYKCDFCDECFIHWNTKKNHMYIKHTRVKKYECYICHRMFGQNGTMKDHVRYHTGDLPHPCPFCHKRFPTASKLKRHIITHRNISAEQKERYLQ